MTVPSYMYPSLYTAIWNMNSCSVHPGTDIAFDWIMTFSFWRSPTFQSSLGGDRAGSLTSAIQGQCGRQAGRQLYYCSGMAGSTEGEALTSILMRLYTAQWPSVCRRIRQKQSHSFQRAFEKKPSLHHLKKKVTCSLFSTSNLSTFETFWHTTAH